jgi:hypothetical protein
MGEARRKRLALENGPCRCGSARLAKLCCYNGNAWHKKSAVLGLYSRAPNSSVSGCYMKELGSCKAPISSEHLVSESVLEVLKGEGDLGVSGAPWMSPCETRRMPIKSLTANCLCKYHNSLLSPLDFAAAEFFSVLKSYLEQLGGRSAEFLISGHDIERWLLKSIKAMAVSGNLGRGKEKLPGAFANDLAVLNMLVEPTCWPQGTGLYYIMSQGQVFENESRFDLKPYINAQDEIYGCALNILGVGFVLMLEPPDLNILPFMKGARHRIGRLSIFSPNSRADIDLSWEDGRPHNNWVSAHSLGKIVSAA